EHIEILNPISNEYNTIRDSVLPSLVKVFSINKHVSLPQKIFEIGDVVKLDDGEIETKTRREVNIAIAVMDNKSDFTVIKELCNSFLKELGFNDIGYEECMLPSFLEGRCAEVKVNNVKVGVIGEIHPQVLVNFELETPISAAEFYFKEIEKILL
ncbi:MAG: phenylalanine--tRNA ligase subunit beta, partial [Candidatus Odinarchaeia archaeon]